MDADKPFEKRFPFKQVPTNLLGAYAVPRPPAGFELAKATSAQLRKYGFPFSRPTARAHPAAIAAWKRAASRKWRVEDWIIPELETVLGKTHHLRDRASNSSSPFWSGAVITGPNGSYNGILAFWRVPTISQPPEAQGSEGGWDSSSWAGIDGWDANDLLQAGVQQYLSGPGAKPQYIAWYQWWIAPPTNPPSGPLDPNGYPEAWVNSKNGTFQYIYQTNYKNFAVTAGDEVMCAIVYRENAAGTVQFSNITTGQTSILNLKPPPTVQFAANNAEWIMELPNGAWPNTSLPKFSQIQFGDAFATIPNCPSAGLPGNGFTLDMQINGIQVTTASASGTEVTIDFTG
jgi:Peptidase A4 family